MAEVIKKLVVNCETGVSEEVELVGEELEEYLANRARMAEQQAAELAAQQAQAEAKASALAKLLALGLSEDEAKAIAGA